MSGELDKAGVVSEAKLRHYIEYAELIGDNGTPAISTGELAIMARELLTARRSPELHGEVELPPVICSAGGVPYNNDHIEYWKARVRTLSAGKAEAEAERDEARRAVAQGIELAAAASLAQTRRIVAAEGEVAKLTDALAELIDTLTPAEQVPFRDSTYGDEIRALGARIGFGALMAGASAEWREWLSANGMPLGSEFVCGPCRSVLEHDLRAARQALPPSPVEIEEL